MIPNETLQHKEKSWRWLCFGVFINKNRNLMQKQCSRKIQSSVFFGVCSSLHLSMSKTPFALLSVVIHSFFTSSISVVLFPFVVVVPSPEYRLLCPSFLWFHPLSKTEAIVLFFLPANTSTLCMKSPYLQNVVAFRLQHMYTPQHHRCYVYPFFWVHSSQTPFCCCHWGSMNKRTVCSFDMTVSLRSLMFSPRPESTHERYGPRSVSDCVFPSAWSMLPVLLFCALPNLQWIQNACQLLLKNETTTGIWAASTTVQSIVIDQ